MSSKPSAARCEHVVQFYESDEELVATVGAYLRDGLRSGEAAIVVATETHRAGLEASLCGETAAGSGTVLFLDAAETLSSFLVDGTPDRATFERVIGDAVRSAAVGGRPVRIFGEMVALLWERGLVLAAIELETYWNDLARTLPFDLFCAYPSEAVMADENQPGLADICSLHTDVLGRPDARGNDRFVVEAIRTFAGTPDGPRAARQFVFEALYEWRQDRFVADAQLIVTELAANAVVHAQSSFTVAISAADQAVRISVTDHSLVLPPVGEPPRNDVIGGRGLQIVAALTTRWSADALPDGKTVWAEVARRSG